MRAFLLGAAAAAGVLGAVDVVHPGGWSPASIPEASPALYGAFQTASSYFVCVANITAVEKQVVAGIKYKFHVIGCPVRKKEMTVPSCIDEWCPASDTGKIVYEISVFEPLGANPAFVLESVDMDDNLEVPPPMTSAPPASSTSPTQAPATTKKESLVGGWGPGNIDDASDDLYNGMSLETSFKSNGTPRLCVTTIDSVTQQVVAGMNYKFEVHGCVVAKAIQGARGCQCASPTPFHIAMFAQSWSHLYEVTSVEPLEASTRSVDGGWSSAEMTATAKQDFYFAMTNDSTNARPICVSSFRHVSSQVVAGTNYRFDVEGCPAPTRSATDAACTCAPEALKSYLITVFVQPWTNTFRVTRVHEEAELLQLVGQWIAANGLNQYGDTIDTVYLGGTPLVNEVSGESTPLLEYVAQRHPDLPWLDGGASHQLSLGLLRGNGATADASAKPLALIGLAASCVLIVSLYVLHKTSRRRHRTYESLQAQASSPRR